MAYNFNQLNIRDNLGVGTDTPRATLEVKGKLKLNESVAVNEFSTDGTFVAASDLSVPTTQAVKTYTSTQIATVNAALDNKADKGGSSNQDFQVNNLQVQGDFEVTGTTTFRNIEQHEGDVELGNEDNDRVKIHGVLKSTHLSGDLQINSPVNITSTITANGNATLNNTFLGDVGHGATYAGFSHKSSVGQISYALLQSNDGIYTLLNKKSGGGFMGFRIDNVDKMIIDDSGNVGIGTAAPNDRLDVAGNLRILTDSNPIRFTSSWSGFPDSTTNQAEICNETNGFKTLMIVGNRSAGLGRRVSIWDRLDVNGNIFVQGTVNQASSIKFKENVANLSIDRAIEALNGLNPVCFSYKADTQKEMHLGFIAEDVPDLVASSDRQSLSAMDIIAVLTGVVKKQQQAIAELTGRVNDLAAKQV